MRIVVVAVKTDCNSSICNPMKPCALQCYKPQCAKSETRKCYGRFLWRPPTRAAHTKPAFKGGLLGELYEGSRGSCKVCSRVPGKRGRKSPSQQDDAQPRATTAFGSFMHHASMLMVHPELLSHGMDEVKSVTSDKTFAKISGVLESNIEDFWKKKGRGEGRRAGRCPL